MPYLTRASPDRELEQLIRLYLKAETDIINEINRLRSQGLTDYHAAAALERVQNILRSLENDCWTYVPKMVEAQFYVRHPDARAVPGETVEKHLTAYRNAQALTSTQTDIVQRLTMNLMGQLTEASATVLSGLQSGLIGRVEPDGRPKRSRRSGGSPTQRPTPSPATPAAKPRSPPTAKRNRRAPAGSATAASGRTTAPPSAVRYPGPSRLSSGINPPGMKSIRNGSRRIGRGTKKISALRVKLVIRIKKQLPKEQRSFRRLYTTS